MMELLPVIFDPRPYYCRDGKIPLFLIAMRLHCHKQIKNVLKTVFFTGGSHFVTTGRVLGAKKGRQVDTDKLVSISRTNNLHRDKSPADLQLIEIVITL